MAVTARVVVLAGPRAGIDVMIRQDRGPRQRFQKHLHCRRHRIPGPEPLQGQGYGGGGPGYHNYSEGLPSIILTEIN